MKRLDGFDQFTAAGRKPRAGKEKSNWRYSKLIIIKIMVYRDYNNIEL